MKLGDYTFGCWVGMMAWRFSTVPIPDWFLYVVPVIFIGFWIRGK